MNKMYLILIGENVTKQNTILAIVQKEHEVKIVDGL